MSEAELIERVFSRFADQGVVPTADGREAVHVGEKDLPYVYAGEGSALQLLHVDLNQGLWISKTRFEPGVEIAKHFKVHPDLHDEFAEWYHDYVSQNPHLFDFTTIYLDHTYIRDWWTDNSYLYDDFLSPYQRTKFK